MSAHTPKNTRPLAVGALSAAALAAALALTSCSSTSSAADGGENGDGALKVVATTTQLQDFVSVIGGDDVALTGLLQAGASAHHFDPSPADLLALSRADVLVVNGAGLETFVDSAVEASGFDGTVITAADGIDLDEAKTITAEGATGADHDHGEHEHEHAGRDHAHADGDHDGHDHDGHDHGDLNPHIWTSPRQAEGMVAEVARGLEEADPEHADAFEQRAVDYAQQLEDLDGWIGEQFEQIPAAERVLVSGHDSLRYYLHDYGIEFAGAILPSFEDNAEPSAAEIDDLVRAIAEHHVKAVFVESSMSPKLAQTVAKESGAKVIDAEKLYADSLGSADSDGATYLAATIANTQTILKAWGGTPGDLPASLLK